MTRVRRKLGARWKAAVLTLAGLLVVSMASVAIADDDDDNHSASHVDCQDPNWNGEFWHKDFNSDDDDDDDGPPKVWTSAGVHPSDIDFDWGRRSSSWMNHHPEFAVVEIHGVWRRGDFRESDLWLPGDSDTIQLNKVKRVTFCFGEIPDPKVNIEKATNGADPTIGDPNYIPAGSDVIWTYEVTNTGNVDLVNVVVTDSDPSVTPVQLGADTVLEPGESWQYTAGPVSAVAAGTKGPGERDVYEAIEPYSNTASVTAESVHDPTAIASDSDNSGYFGSDASIYIDVTSPGVVTIPDPATWTVYLLNTGNVDLGAILVKDDLTKIDQCRLTDGTPIPNCDIPDLAPGADITVLYDEPTDVPEPDHESEFVVEATGADGTTTSEDTDTVSFTLNNAPTADSAELFMQHLTALGVPAELSGSLADLAGDEDAGDDLDYSVVPGEGVTKGTLILNGETGAFTYTPDLAQIWPLEAPFVITDSFEYSVTDGYPGSSAQNTVTITIERNLCLTQTVFTPPGGVEAQFTLESLLDGECKGWPDLTVTIPGEEPVDGTVLFVPPGDGSMAEYTGVLIVQDVDIDFADLDEVTLLYDRDGEDSGFGYTLVPDCDGTTTNPSLPSLPSTDTWCFYDVDLDLDNGNWDITWYVLGEDDPGFRFK